MGGRGLPFAKNQPHSQSSIQKNQGFLVCFSSLYEQSWIVAKLEELFEGGCGERTGEEATFTCLGLAII